MTCTVEQLKNHVPSHEYFIAIDSDGCVFDTMEIKQKECFIPQIVKVFGLQGISKYVRASAEFVNLYSKWRGINRFPAVLKTFDLLEDWDKVQERHVEIPKLPNVRRWVETETRLGNPVLKAYCATHDDPDMHQMLAWSEAVNRAVEDIVQGGLPPFPFVVEVLERAKDKADLLVCSQTPTEALVREWEEQGIDKYVLGIAGQELGTKAEHIKFCSEGRYEKEKMLMIGDAPGDMKAARANGILFYPINPGGEEASWQRLHEEGLDRFFNGEFAGAYEDALIQEFEACLPSTPPWKLAEAKV